MPLSTKSKIGRLPYEVRRQLNLAMRDGRQDKDVLAWLNGLPATKTALSGVQLGGRRQTRAQVSPQNLSEYRHGPYADWLKEQDEIERIQTLSEFAYRVAEVTGGDVTSRAASIAGGKILQLLETVNDADLINVASALAKLNKSDADKLRAHTDRQRLPMQQAAQDLTREKFERDTARLFVAWFDDKHAREIAESDAPAEVKMDRLIERMFGTPPEKAAAS